VLVPSEDKRPSVGCSVLGLADETAGDDI
jgi:hypothetical protein